MGSYDHLWAPWRMGYILGEEPKASADDLGSELPPGADPDCFLCQGAADPDPRSRHVVRKTQHSVTLLNRYPYNNGHLLVAPRRHRARLDELTAEEQLDLIRQVSQMILLLEKVVRPEGFNVGLNLGRAAGAGLPGHLHWHVVPRWVGDTNFMPTLAAVKIIPQALETLWEAMTGELGKA